MPRALAARPRKMVPPPSTMPVRMPMAWTSRISPASRPITTSSIPCPPGPARISPLSLRRIRRKRAATELLLPEAEPGEPPYDDVLAGLGHSLLHDVGDRLLVVPNVRLLEQADLGEEPVELPADDLLD